MYSAIKIIGTGLLGGLVMLAISILSSGMSANIFPGLPSEYQNQALFRSWQDPLMLIYFFVPFFSGIILAWFWSCINASVPGKTGTSKGLRFGLAYWLIGIPGMLMTWSSFTVSLPMVVSWSLGSILEALAMGFTVAKMLPVKDEEINKDAEI